MLLSHCSCVYTRFRYKRKLISWKHALSHCFISCTGCPVSPVLLPGPGSCMSAGPPLPMPGHLTCVFSPGPGLVKWAPIGDQSPVKILQFLRSYKMELFGWGCRGLFSTSASLAADSGISSGFGNLVFPIWVWPDVFEASTIGCPAFRIWGFILLGFCGNPCCEMPWAHLREGRIYVEQTSKLTKKCPPQCVHRNSRSKDTYHLQL